MAEAGEGTATSLAAALPVSRPAVIKHLAALEKAGLVAHHRAGREVRYAPLPARLAQTAAALHAVAAEWDTRLAALQRLAEDAPGA